MKGLLSIISILLLANFFFVDIAHAASIGSGIANYVKINGKVQDGNIVSFSPQGYKLSTVAYDSNMSGVVETDSAISLVTQDVKNNYPIVKTGMVRVLVAGVGGSIAKGDLITSSQIAGVGMKAEHSGYVIGAAVEGHKFLKTSDIADVSVMLDPHYYVGRDVASSSLKDIFNLSMIATYEKPSTVVKYVIAAFITVLSFGAGFFIFQKTVLKGIDSIGRNPLAAHIIQLGMLVSIIVTIAVVSGGLFIAYLVLRI